jgi:hypothetical protein
MFEGLVSARRRDGGNEVEIRRRNGLPLRNEYIDDGQWDVIGEEVFAPYAVKYLCLAVQGGVQRRTRGR